MAGTASMVAAGEWQKMNNEGISFPANKFRSVGRTMDHDGTATAATTTSESSVSVKASYWIDTDGDPTETREFKDVPLSRMGLPAGQDPSKVSRTV